MSRPAFRNLLHVTNRREWRAWLKAHYKSEKDVWLVYHKKGSGLPRIPYNDAVEEALCFGWIDSTTRKIDENRFAQRFSRRNPKSPYSQANKERLRALVKRGKVAKDILAGLGDIVKEKFVIPPDILGAVRANREAWKNFRRFSPTYKRIRIGYIDGARDRPSEFQKRLRHFIARTEQNTLFGFGGIGKYY
jgi:uncharacterized protein YdeI (YjbR/CyaY-like superfamily)